MKRLLWALIVCGLAVPVFGQPGALLPALPPSFLNASGLAAAGGKLCFLKAGTTTTWQSVYSDSALASPLPNPVSLNAIGVPQTSGNVSTAIYLSASGGGNYKVILYAQGTGNTCNGTSVGAVIWTRDNVYDFGQLLPVVSQVKNCTTYSGVNAGAKIIACIAALPATGGTADARGFEGAQAITSAIVMTKAVRLELGAATFSSNVATAATVQLFAGSVLEGQGAGVSTIAITVDDARADAVSAATGAIIRNVTLQGHTTHTSGSSGIDGCDCQNVEVDNVEISNWGSHGINSGGNDSNGYWHIHDSYIHDNYDDGVLLGGVGGHRVISNRFDLNGSNAVDLNSPNNKVVNNYIDRSGGNYSGGGTDCDGVLATSIYGNTDDSVIEGNTITRTQCVGVRFRADASGHTNGTKIVNNTISNGVTANAHGILGDTSVGSSCGTTSNTIISANRIIGNAGRGILFGGGTTPCVIDSSIIIANSITGNTGLGIQVAFGTGGTIEFNTVLSNTAGQIDTSGSTLTLALCNKTSAASNACAVTSGSLATPTLAVDTISADLGSTVTLSGTVNASGTFSVGNSGNGPISKTFIGFATLDFPSTNAQKKAALTISVTGVVDQDMCMVGPPGASVIGDSLYSCYVSGADTVTVLFNNYSAGALDPSSGQFKVFLVHF